MKNQNHHSTPVTRLGILLTYAVFWVIIAGFSFQLVTEYIGDPQEEISMDWILK